MKQNIIHIGLDVDDTQYHGAAFNKETGEVIEFCDPRIHDIIRTASELNNFKPLYHSLYIYGVSADIKGKTTGNR